MCCMCCFFKSLESVEVLALVGCHHGFNPLVMVITLPLVAGIAIDCDDPSRCRKCKCHLPHELVAQKWCHFLVRRLRNTQVTAWVRMCMDANQARRPRSKTLPWSTKRWDDVIFPIQEKDFNKLWLELVGSLHRRFFVTSKFHRNILKTKSRETQQLLQLTLMSPNLRAETETWNQWFRCKRAVLGEGPGWSRLLETWLGRCFTNHTSSTTRSDHFEMLWIPCQSSSLFAGLPQTRVLVWFVSKFHLFSGVTNMESATSCQLYELFSSKTCMHHAQKTATALLREISCWRGTRRIRVPMLTNTPAIPSRLLHNNRHAPQWATELQKDRVSWGFGGGGEATPSWMRHHGCPQNLCWGYCINYCRRRFAQVERDVSVFGGWSIIGTASIGAFGLLQHWRHVFKVLTPPAIHRTLFVFEVLRSQWQGSINRKNQHMRHVVSTQ